MARNGRTLDRLLRVRTLQLNLAHAEEARAGERVASEAALRARIDQLAANVEPAETTDDAFRFAAAAHFRERLHKTAAAADQRLRTAEAQHARAEATTRAARRDQSAVEKLIARADAEEALKALRALQEAPPVRRVRHDPC